MLPALILFVAVLQTSLVQSIQGWHDRYHNLDEIVQKLKDINSTYDKANLFSIGKSSERRDMWAIKISGKPRENKPVFFIQCLIHAREWTSASNCMYFADKMSSEYARQDYYVTQMLDKMDFVLLPVMNVDGYVYSWANSVTRNWQKNRRRVTYIGSKVCYGVDLDRNFGYKWGNIYGNIPSGESIEPCKDTYRGYSAFSEIETRNVRDYLISLGENLKGFIDFQAYGQQWHVPWRHTNAETPDYKEQQRVSIAAARAIYWRSGYRESYMCCFSEGTPGRPMWAGGSSLDWVYGQLGVKYSFKVKLRDRGRYKYNLPGWMIARVGEETFIGLKALVAAMQV